MKAPVAMGLAALALTLSAGAARTEQYGTATEGKFMLERAVALLAASKVTALREFNDEKDRQFHDRDLYVLCMNTSDGKFTAHPNPSMIGTDARNVKINDDPPGQRIYDAIKAEPEGSVVTVDYMLPKPGTTEPISNQSLVMRAGDQGCAVAYYK
jgi:hypothetical protein